MAPLMNSKPNRAEIQKTAGIAVVIRKAWADQPVTTVMTAFVL